MMMTLHDEPPKNCNLANIRQSELKQKICIKNGLFNHEAGKHFVLHADFYCQLLHHDNACSFKTVFALL